MAVRLQFGSDAYDQSRVLCAHDDFYVLLTIFRAIDHIHMSVVRANALYGISYSRRKFRARERNSIPLIFH